MATITFLKTWSKSTKLTLEWRIKTLYFNFQQNYSVATDSVFDLEQAFWRESGNLPHYFFTEILFKVLLMMVKIISQRFLIEVKCLHSQSLIIVVKHSTSDVSRFLNLPARETDYVVRIFRKILVTCHINLLSFKIRFKVLSIIK